LKVVLVEFEVIPAVYKFVVVTELLTARLLKSPTDVILGWAACETTRATVAFATFPVTFEPDMFARPEAFEAIKRPFTVRAVSVPTDVMLG
jgi:hypothetical protein